MQQPPHAIEIKDSWKSYDGGASFAVRGISLDVGSGEFLALNGQRPNTSPQKETVRHRPFE